MNKMLKKIITNSQKIMEVAAVVIMLVLIFLMFTGKVGTIISLTAFSVLIIAANLPIGRKSKNYRETEDKSNRDICSRKEKISTEAGRVA